ncbi:TPA: acyltransferase family protein [Citrobacter braakii]
MTKRVFRGDIEGLRAYAVLFVLLFHAGLAFDGGFIGVDIFFVISGFLITGNLLRRDINLLTFYKKRIIRLYPALCLTVLLTLAAAFLLLDPQLFVETAKSAIYTILSVSNFYFAYDGGYFATASNLKPLLHTWSLGVEQQFYLIWPLVILLVKKAPPRFCLLILAIVTLTSLLLSQVWISINSDTAYFLLPFRLFELSIGGLIAATRFSFKGWVSEFSFVAGMVTILYGAFFYSSTVPFPGIYAFLPCAGAALCIISGQSKLSSILMGNVIARFIGRISYSVYLVHWPIIVIYSYFIFTTPNTMERICMVAASILAAIPIYYYCEHKCQVINDTGTKTAKPLFFSGLSLFVVVTSSILIIKQSGMNWRLPENALSFESKGVKFHRENWGGAGFDKNGSFGTGSRKAIITGDSFAMHLFQGLNENLGNKFTFNAVSEHGCIFGNGISRWLDNTPREACIDTFKNLKNELKGNSYPLIIAFSWSSYISRTASVRDGLLKFKSIDEFNDFLVDNAQSIINEAGSERKIIIFGNTPINSEKKNMPISSCIERPDFIHSSCEKYITFDLSKSESVEVNRKLMSLSKNNKNVIFIDPSDILCNKNECQEIDQGNIVYSDGTHLSKYASRKLISGIIKKEDTFL